MSRFEDFTLEELFTLPHIFLFPPSHKWEFDFKEEYYNAIKKKEKERDDALPKCECCKQVLKNA